MRILAHQLLLDNHAFAGEQIVTVENGRILSVFPSNGIFDLEAAYLTPGLIDVHCHGGEGFNARDFDTDHIRPFLERMLRDGVTDFLMTISTGRKELMRHGLEVTRKAMEMQKNGKLDGARILGAHLEGPFLSPKRAGAMQISAMARPGKEAFLDLFDGYEDIIRLVTLAPEEEGADELIHYLTAKGIRVQAGHTDATYEQAMRGFASGITSMCHSFNGCRGIHHREPGVVMAAMENPEIYMEAICDLVHLHPAILRLIHRMKGPDRMMIISDSVATHGIPDGEYFMEGYHIIVKDGVSRTASGALDGGGAYLAQAVRNMHSIGIPLGEAMSMACHTPAERLGLNGYGTIIAGSCDHLVGWNDDLQPIFAVTNGISTTL